MIDEKKFMQFMTSLEEAGAEHVSFDDLRKFIDEFPKAGEWIPCKDRLPDTRNNILICQKDGYVSVGYYSQGQFLDLNSVEFNDVIAWQSLPEAYHGQMD